MQIFWIQIEVCVILTVTAILDGLRTSKVKIARLIYSHLPILLNLGKKCQNENNLSVKVTSLLMMLLMISLRVPNFASLVLLPK